MSGSTVCRRVATFGLSLILLASVGCGVPPADRALESHRRGLAPWVTEDIREEGRDLWVTVATDEPTDALGIATRIIDQRRSQGWQTIHVEVRPRVDGRGQPVTVTARYPFVTDDGQVVAR